jgi:hypothetical protein
VPGFDQIVDRGRADFPARPGDEDLHTALLPRSSGMASAPRPRFNSAARSAEE